MSDVRSKFRESRGNVIIMLALTLSGIMAVGAVVIDTTLYLLRRQEVQSLAESVALGAALNLPQSYFAQDRAEAWYDKLRIDNGHEIAPDRNADSSALTITFDDNASSTSATTPYLVNSITVKVRATYTTNLLKIPGVTKSTINVVGQATAQLKPTDVVMIIENSSSLYEIIDDDNPTTNPFANYFAEKMNRLYAGQCFNPSLLEFKKGALALYDILSEIGTYRVGVIHTSSRTGDPFVTADLGTTTITGADLEYQGDDKDYPSTRCILGTSLDAWAVPEPPSAKGDWWTTARADLTPLVSAGKDVGDYSVKATEALTVREAIWFNAAGHQTRTIRYQNPQSLFTNPSNSLQLAEQILINSRRSDDKPVSTRIILYITDGVGARLGTAPDAETITPQSFVDSVVADGNMNSIKLGVIYFGHREDLEFHGWDKDDSYSHSDEMRNICLLQGTSTSGIFLSETSPAAGLSESDFQYKTVPMIAHGIKEAELVE